MELFALIGQAIIGIVYLAGAVTDIMDRKVLLQMLQRKNYLRYEEYLMYGAIALKVICGLGLVFNTYPSIAAFFLAGFTLIANIIFHPFWLCAPTDRKKEYFAFMGHLAIIGGLLVVFSR